MDKYRISFYTRSQSVKGHTEDWPVINILVSHPKFKGRKFRYSTGELIHASLWKERKPGKARKKKESYGLNTHALESSVPLEAQMFFDAARFMDGTELKTGYKVNGVIVQGTKLMALNQKLSDLQRKIQLWIDANALKPDFDKDALKKALDGDKPVKTDNSIDVFKKWEEIINTTLTKGKDPITPGTKRAKTSTLTRVKEFFGDRTITFESFDQEFYDSFMKWMAAGDSKLKPPRAPMLKNTRGKHIKEIKSVLRRVLKYGIPVSPAFLDNSAFTTVEEDTDQIYLTESELTKMLKLKLTKRLEDFRDIFVCVSYVGARFGDWDKIRSSNIITKDGIDILRYKSSKTNTYCSVQVHPIVSSILKKHGGVMPEQVSREDTISNQKTNEALKELGEKISLDIKTHTARRSFATNCYLAQVPPAVIMLATGHKSEKMLKKYIRADDLQQAIAHAKNDKTVFFKNDADVVMEVSKSLAS